MRTKPCWVLAVLAGACPALADGPLHVVSRSVDVDQGAKVVRFEVTYDRAPDFYTLDSEGRPADSFQFQLDTVAGNQGIYGISPYPWEMVVRGDEIHLKGDIPVRDHTRGPSSAPESGGWGPAVGSVPFTLSGERQTFEVPLSMLNATDGVLAYSLEVYHYGSLAERLDSAPAPVIPPPAGHPVPVPDGGEGDVSAAGLAGGLVMAVAWPVAALVVIGYLHSTHALRRRRGASSPLRPVVAHRSGKPGLSGF